MRINHNRNGTVKKLLHISWSKEYLAYGSRTTSFLISSAAPDGTFEGIYKRCLCMIGDIIEDLESAVFDDVESAVLRGLLEWRLANQQLEQQHSNCPVINLNPR